MKRRKFIVWSTSATIALAYGGIDHKEQDFFESLMGHLFPKSKMMPASNPKTLASFLLATIMHPCYDPDIRDFVLEGAKVLQKKLSAPFEKLNATQKEKALREFEKSRFGYNWLARVLTIGLEGLLGDPIYGANAAGINWKALKTAGGLPRPKEPYLGAVCYG